eukprot:c7115_g1_i1 orf=360-1814(-)
MPGSLIQRTMPGIYSLQPLTCPTRTSGGSSPKTVRAPKSEKKREEKSQQQPPRLRKLPPILISSAGLLPSQTHTCARPIRPKQVTDPLTETVRAKFYGSGINAERAGPYYGSSGSDHEPSSVYLAALVHQFLEDDIGIGSCDRDRCNCSEEICICEDDYGSMSIDGNFCEILEGVVSSKGNSEVLLLSDVNMAMKLVNENANSLCRNDGLKCSTHGTLRRFVMTYLRQAGYNAAICKSKWEHTGGFPAGDYEYIDVIMDGKYGKYDRFIVDLNFKAQFEIARASRQYNHLLQLLPDVFVGVPERLQQILKIISEAVKRSLKKRGMHLPPWRKQQYLQAKWFSAYKRTTNKVSQAPQNSDHVFLSEFSSIALCGSHFCSQYTEMEIEREMPAQPTKKCNRNDYGNIPFSPESFTGQQQKADQPQLLRENCSVGNHYQEITVMSSEWQLPDVTPRKGVRGEMVSGLATAVRDAGLCGVLHHLHHHS